MLGGCSVRTGQQGPWGQEFHLAFQSSWVCVPSAAGDQMLNRRDGELIR